ncbi:cupin domain-containing protein [Rhodocyclus tenuis]|uniref:Cupin domain-containing protein n=1 Tax=Rhodocyclus tenuis TaxID=1066 RepID=A0A6L5JWZ4_RHOTE|nr:XRE family transcriptional regulator [Rhodocyclus gracilis]MQY51134.1 cupin domain-containing protein [Rhodocyclus gracilis]MRD71982.1 cupin domain-containing protein [Rhodocyclus gracilis]
MRTTPPTRWARPSSRDKGSASVYKESTSPNEEGDATALLDPPSRPKAHKVVAPPPPAFAPAAAHLAHDDDDELPQLVGKNLKKLRKQHRFSLDRLAQRSGVSRAMLGQIELGRSVPTIRLLWRIAQAFKVPVSAFLDDGENASTVVLTRQESRVLASHDGQVTSRALFPFHGSRQVEFYEMRFAPGILERSDPHPPATTENLVVASGELELQVDTHSYRLGTGDAIHFDADVAHSYRNPGDVDAQAFVVISYPDEAEYR